MHDTHITPDERWLSEWMEFGLRELEHYLGKHRRFDDYYAGRERRRQSLTRGR